MKKTKKNIIVRAAYGTTRSVGSVVGASFSLARGIGRSIGRSYKTLAGVGSKILPRFSNQTKHAKQKTKSVSSREHIRSVVIEELARLHGTDGRIFLPKLEKRLQVMADTILALQERINELSSRGLISEADMFKEISSLEAAESLTDEERALLVNVFRQNIAIQKPDLVGIAIDSY
jgi:hypothetical protein